MLTVDWKCAPPLPHQWSFQQDSLDHLLFGGSELRESQRRKTVLVTDSVTFASFFWSSKTQDQPGFEGKGNRLLLDKRSGMFLQGREKLLAAIFGDNLLQGKL